LFAATIKCHDPNGELYTVTISRSWTPGQSSADDAIRTKVGTWVDTVAESKNSCEFIFFLNRTSCGLPDPGAFGGNEHLRKIFWTLFRALTGLMLARIAARQPHSR
jgi:hypothetical protein